MMNAPTFALATFALLVVPGLTNALLAAAGAGSAKGWARLPFIAAVPAGYAVSVGALSLLGAATSAEWPHLVVAFKIIAASWLLLTRVTLWRGGVKSPRAGGRVRAHAVFVTTLFNPKGLALAFGLMPPLARGVENASYHLAAVACLSALAAAVWMRFGVWLARVGVSAVVPRVTALVFALFGAMLVASAAS